MKKIRFSLAILALALVVVATALAFVGCKADSEPTYTVWATTMSYSEWSAIFGGGYTLPDNSFSYGELSNSEFNQYKPYLLDEYKHDYTEEQLYNWFLGRSFGETTAKMLTAWLITIDHGSIALRRGSQVHGIAK
jgi:hypothetical protein